MSRLQPSTACPDPAVRIRVWFGRHVIAEYVDQPDAAARYAEAMRARFAGLRVTSDLCPSYATTVQPPALPSERLWDLTP